MTIFGGFWAPFGRPLELIFGTLGVILGIEKLAEKKMQKKFSLPVPLGRFCGMRGSPGRIWEGSKVCRKVKSNKEQSKEEEVIREHCQVIPHAPCPPQGGGRIDHPQGGTTARPPFRAVPQRAVDIIWRCAGGDQHNAVCWACAGFVLGLCQVCAGVVLPMSGSPQSRGSLSVLPILGSLGP